MVLLQVKKRQTSDAGLEWTQTVLKMLKDLLLKLADHYRITGTEKVESFSTALVPVGMPSASTGADDYESLMKQWKYLFGLAQHLYDHGLLDRHEVRHIYSVRKNVSIFLGNQNNFLKNQNSQIF